MTARPTGADRNHSAPPAVSRAPRAADRGLRDSSARYDDVAQRAAAVVIGRYSTSFGAASRLLAPPLRRHVRNIYALVRVADEAVDGVGAGHGLDDAAVLAALDELEAQTEAALRSGYSANVVVHAFAVTARRTGIGPELTRPFFASMRTDAQRSEHDPTSFDAYVHGSAEVVGQMCLRAFFDGAPVQPVELSVLDAGARRLGAAFQKVNFLRDVGADVQTLGRRYFPGVDPAQLTETEKRRLVADIDADLAAARAVIGRLPAGARAAVLAAHDLFAELNARLRRTPAADLLTTRVSVPTGRKARIVAGAVLGAGRFGARRGGARRRGREGAR